MEVLKLVTEVIDLRSFSNLWYWITLAVFWSAASHFILGIPYDMVMRARRFGGFEEEELDTLAHLLIRRNLRYVDLGAVYFVAVAAFLLAVNVTFALYYKLEFAQAMLALYLPFLLIIGISIHAARRIARLDLRGPALHKQLLITRLVIQGIGIIFILLTAFWGMYVAFSFRGNL